jgi:hypothetical protein
MTLSLYSAADELAPLLDQIDEDGVISEELMQALSVFEGKGIAVTAYILNCEANAKMIEDAADKMRERAKPLKNRVERLKQYLADNMKRTGINELTCPQFSAKLYINRDDSVEITDAKLLPIEFMREPKPVEPAPDKVAIKKALKLGNDVNGARLVYKDRLTIS